MNQNTIIVIDLNRAYDRFERAKNAVADYMLREGIDFCYVDELPPRLCERLCAAKIAWTRAFEEADDFEAKGEA